MKTEFNNQTKVGNTTSFGNDLNNQDGVTLIGWNNQHQSDLVYMLSAASQARFKDGIVHIDARLLESLLIHRLTSGQGNIYVGQHNPTRQQDSSSITLLVSQPLLT